jgi:hypothetical protein
MNDVIGKEQGIRSQQSVPQKNKASGVSNPFPKTTHDRGKIYFKTIQISRALL